MIATKRREEFKDKINNRLKNDFNISVTPVKSVEDLKKRENFESALKPSRKTFRIMYRVIDKK